MKKIYIICLFLVGILLISGCWNPTEEVVMDTPTEINDVVCNKPYILVGNNCCLDQNDNSICDTDEAQSSPTGGPLLSQNKIIEDCNSGNNRYLYCESYTINKDKITLKLKSVKSNYQALERIYLPQIGLDGCELNINTSFDNALAYQETRIY